jgi:hypothetical protein
MKNIFYILSILVIGGAGYFSWQNSEKIQDEITKFDETRTKKRNLEGTIEKVEVTLKDTKASLKTANQRNSELASTKDNEEGKHGQMLRSKEKFQVQIDESNETLGQFAKIKEEIDKKLVGVNISWNEIPDHISMLKETRKRKGDDLDLLITLTEKLTKEVKDKRVENSRQGNRLSDIRMKIARNAKVGAITSVNSTWGFVIINLGTSNSNVTVDSKLLITRNGRLLGHLKPNSVEPNQTVCDLNARDLTPGVRIQPGDQVTLAESVGN